MDKISFITDDGSEIELFVFMDTVLFGNEYVLVSEDDPEGEDCECFIMKKTGEEGDESLYETVEDEKELQAVFDVFSELMNEEDIDLEI